MEILDKIDQKKISKGLRKGDFKEDRLQRKEAEWQIKLRKCTVDLTEDLTVDEILLAHLHQEGLLSVYDTDRLKFPNNPDKTPMFLRILRKKPFFFKEQTNVRDVFIKALEEQGQSHLIEALNNAEMTEEDYREYEGMKTSLRLSLYMLSKIIYLQS